jgi:hypothetical protein
MAPVTGDRVSPVAQSAPLAVYGQDQRASIWNYICDHHDGGRVATATNTALPEYALVIWPPKGQPEESFIRHTGQAFDIGLFRALWSKVCRIPVNIELHACTYLTKPDNFAGYMRLGRLRAPDPSHTASIPILEQSGSMRHLSWDEESGRIVILRSSFQEPLGRLYLLVVDLV